MNSARAAATATLFLTICAPLGAQPELFSKAPPEIDNALRDRVGKFYQAHVDAKFRRADQYVAEDSKDAFFEADKIHYHNYRIEKIEYADGFTKAKVLTACGADFRRAGDTFLVTIPVLSTWKLVDGEWFWYFVPQSKVQTPWGFMQGGAASQQPKPPVVPNIAATAADILRQVSVDRTEIMLSSYEPAREEVHIANSMPGEVTLRVEYQGFAGLQIALDKTTVKGGERASLLLECHPADRTPKPTVTARVIVDQTGQVIPIKVTFAVPPEILEKLPK